MKQNAKKLIRYCGVLLLIFSIFAAVFTVSAQTGEFALQITNATAIPGDTILFNVDIEKNPGIMAMTVTFHYDPAVLEYKGYVSGIIPEDTIASHNGYVSIVWCGGKDRTNNGTLFSMRFTVKENAEVGKYPVMLKHIYPDKYGTKMDGCFANWDRVPLKPTVQNGSLEIKYNGKNCTHRFSDWETVIDAGCTTKGTESHTCSKCGHTELRETASVGHSYGEVYTVDQAASSSEIGILSRHCTRCESVTDKIYFTVEEAKLNGVANKIGATAKIAAWKTEEPETDRPPVKPSKPEPQKPTSPQKDKTESPKPTDPNPPTAAELIEEIRENQTDPQTPQTVTVMEEIGFWKYILGENGSGGLFREMIAVLPAVALRLARAFAGLLLLIF